MEEIRISAKTLDEAKTQALLKLNTSGDHIEFKVIEEGSSGLLGFIGSKPWVITARVKSDAEMEAEAAKAEADRKAAEDVKKAEELRKAEEVKKAEELRKAEESSLEEKVKDFAEDAETKVIAAVDEIEADLSLEEAKKELKAESADMEKATSDRADEKSGKEVIEPVGEEEAARLITTGEEFLKSIFAVMDIEAEINAEFDHSTNEIYYEFNGDDMGVLIGKRGQTLDSLQYLTSLVVNKHRSGYIRVKLDTENYRDRRKGKLEDLAHNIAQKVKRSRHKVELEPMNPYERRIIHSALQNDPYVTTVSEGEEPYRHVVIMLKKDPNHRRYNNRGYGKKN